MLWEPDLERMSLGEHSEPTLHHKPLRIILSQKKAESFIKHRACVSTETWQVSHRIGHRSNLPSCEKLQPSLWQSEFKTSPKRVSIPSTTSKFQPLRVYRELLNGEVGDQSAVWMPLRNKSTFHFQTFLSFCVSGLETSRDSCSHKPAAETKAEGQLPVPGHHLAPDSRPHPVFSLKWKETAANALPSGV